MRIKDFFIPHEGNDYKPDALQRVSVGVMFALIVLSFTLANLQALLWIASDWMVTAVLPGVLVELTNEERTENALGSLQTNPVLAEAATLKAEHMAENEYFAHYAPDGTSPWYWFEQVSYDFVHAGENLAVHFTESDEVVNAWMESPAHRANILDGKFTEIGIGTAKGEYKGFPTVYVVQLFGTPAAVSGSELEPEPEEPEPTDGTPEVLASESDNSTGTENEVTLETTRDEPTTQAEDEDAVAPARFETFEAEKETSSSTGTSTAPRNASSTPVATSTDVVESKSATDTVTVYSDLATTTRGGVPAATEPTDITSAPESTPYARIFAKSALIPSVWLQAFYGALALFVTIALIISIVVEWRRQHPVQIAYGTGLLATMAVLFYVHTTLSSGVTII